MIDVNKITSTLAKLPDAQLQQYAQMHKADPYIMALAMSESNRRKELRAASQAPAQQEQPKVVDQMVAEMAPQQLPEDQGIGQLPAGNMDFAGGGIVAFADGGDVERYQVGGSIFDRMDQQKASQLAQLNSQLAMVETQLRAAATSGDPQAIQAYAQQAQTIRGQINAVRESAGNRIGLVEGTSAPSVAPPARATPTMPTGQFNRVADAEKFDLPAFSPEISRGMLNQANSAYYAAPAETKPAQAADAAPKVDATSKTSTGKGDTDKRTSKASAGSAATTKAAASRDDPFSIESILKAQEQTMRDVNYQQGALQNQAVGLGNLYEQQAEERLTRRKKEIEGEGDIYKGREDRLKAREADIGKQKDQNTGLALLNAGLAIMSTPGNLATAIGKGAQVGTAQYASGLKDLRNAQQKLEDARDNIEELRLNRKDMNSKEIRALEKERDDNLNKGKQLMFDLAKDRFGVSEKNATEAFKSYMQGQKTVFEQGEQTKRSDKSNAAMAANRPYDIQGELTKAILAGDEPRVKKLKQALTTVGEAKKPGLDMELIKKFENLPGVKTELGTLSALRGTSDPKPETIARIQRLEQSLAAKARANQIDPAQLGLGGSGLASPTGGRTIDFNAIP